VLLYEIKEMFVFKATQKQLICSEVWLVVQSYLRGLAAYKNRQNLENSSLKAYR
jgi:hypothetical protein